jgi:hypothetical protein
MEKSAVIEPTAEETARMHAEIEQSLVEITQLRESMRRDQSEIEKSRSRTLAMLARLQAG